MIKFLNIRYDTQYEQLLYTGILVGFWSNSLKINSIREGFENLTSPKYSNPRLFKLDTFAFLTFFYILNFLKIFLHFFTFFAFIHFLVASLIFVCLLELEVASQIIYNQNNNNNKANNFIYWRRKHEKVVSCSAFCYTK